MKVLKPRCRHCGQRLESLTVSRCPECGEEDAPLAPPDPDQLQSRVIRRSMLSGVFVVLPSLLVLTVVLAIEINSYELYMAAIMLCMFMIPVCGVVLIILSIEWVPTALEVIWSRRNGSVGPWSGLRTRSGLAVGLSIFLLVVAGGLLGLVSLIPQQYPGGWP